MQDEQEALGISLHAISGAHSFDTMRVRGIFGSVSTIILLDSGSTHNFLSEHFANLLGLRPINTKQFKVTVASGDKLPSRGKCIGVQLKMGSFTTKADFFILPLELYEVVMGTQ